LGTLALHVDLYRRLRGPSGEDNGLVIARMSETDEYENGALVYGDFTVLRVIGFLRPVLV
jgi:hypothetical protein